MNYRLRINGEEREVETDSGTPLLWVLRDALGLTGTKYGCGIAQCGACTVHLDGKPVRSCVTPMRNLGKRRVTTMEGVEGLVAQAVRESWLAIQVPQCGYCQSGQIMTAIALLESNSRPGAEDIDGALAGNICRCATYPRIRQAVREAAAKVRS